MNFRYLVLPITVILLAFNSARADLTGTQRIKDNIERQLQGIDTVYLSLEQEEN